MPADLKQKEILNLLHGSFPLLVTRQVEQRPIALHSHPYTELVVILGGSGVHYSGEDAYEISAGDCFVVEGAHGYRDGRNLSLVNVLFLTRSLRIPWDEARKLPGYHAFFALEPRYRKVHHFRSRLRLSPPELARVSSMLDDLESEINSGRPGRELMALSHFMELLGFLSRAYEGMKGGASSGLRGLSEAMGLMERSFAEPLSMERLAGTARMSGRQFLRAFRTATGRSPVDYLIRLRVRKAGELLRRTRLSVTEIAGRSGFNDSNYFTRQFRRVTGVSPREFRRASGTGPEGP